MGHTHLNLEVELGYSHLLSTMEIASSSVAYTMLGNMIRSVLFIEQFIGQFVEQYEGTRQ